MMNRGRLRAYRMAKDKGIEAPKRDKQIKRTRKRKPRVSTKAHKKGAG